MKSQSLCILSFGCTANQNNAEILKGFALRAGISLIENPQKADIILLNTCIVKGKIENAMKHLIFKFSPKPIIVAGCMPELSYQEFSKPNIFLLHNLKDLPKIINSISKSKKISTSKNKETKLNLSKVSASKFIGITQISEGCLGSCSFCITRLAKGRLFSYPEKAILQNIEQDIKAGAKEIWLTSQDNGAYGLDKGKHLLPKLLKQILSLDGDFKVRLGMMNPNHLLPILNEMIKIYQHPKMFKFLHLPLQSGSDKVLKEMNRFYSTADFLKIIDAFRKEIPEITIATDAIVAYPTETLQDFKDSLAIIHQAKPLIMNMSRYWPRQLTPASKLKPLPDSISKSRVLEMRRIHLQIAETLYKNYLNTTMEFLIDKQGKAHTWLGRNQNYQLVAVNSKNNLLGKTIKAKIKSADAHYLIGEIVEQPKAI